MIDTSRRRLGFAAAGLLYVAAALAVAAPASADEKTTKVGSVAEAWYVTPADAACSAPIGCPPQPEPIEASPYPEGTLHVGVSNGRRVAHAYVAPDLASLPFEATLTSGKLTLPISQDPRAGNAAVDSAELVTCLVTDPVTDGVEGGTTGAPAFDCDAAESPARLSGDAKSFTVDLTPFAEAWSAGEPEHGVALVPAEEQQLGASWQVTFTGKKADAKPRIKATLRYEVEPTADIAPALPPGEPEPAAPPPQPLGLGALPVPAGADSPAVEEAPMPPPTAPDKQSETQAAPEVAPAPQATRAGLRNTAWYRYPGVVYLPLTFLVTLAALGRALTRPLSPTPLRPTR